MISKMPISEHTFQLFYYLEQGLVCRRHTILLEWGKLHAPPETCRPYPFHLPPLFSPITPSTVRIAQDLVPNVFSHWICSHQPLIYFMSSLGCGCHGKMIPTRSLVFLSLSRLGFWDKIEDTQLTVPGNIGDIDTKEIFIVYLKSKCNWVSLYFVC